MNYVAIMAVTTMQPRKRGVKIATHQFKYEFTSDGKLDQYKKKDEQTIVSAFMEAASGILTGNETDIKISSLEQTTTP